MNIKAKSATQMKKSLIICRYQVNKFDCPDISNINYISEDIVSLWYEIIYHGSQPTEIDTNMDMDYNHHKSNLSGYPNSSTGILEPIIGKIEISEKHLTKIKSSYLGDNPQAITLCDIIQNQLPLNYL